MPNPIPPNWFTDSANIGTLLLYLRQTCSNTDEVDDMIRFVCEKPWAYADEFRMALRAKEAAERAAGVERRVEALMGARR